MVHQRHTDSSIELLIELAAVGASSYVIGLEHVVGFHGAGSVGVA
jgi:hypothetical protein